MQRYKCILSYDGKGFAGYQVQPGKRTVQGELEAALAKLHKGTAVNVTASGRTDSGVHAKGQVIHFDSPLSIPVDRWPVALNSMISGEISILTVEKADPGFHARFDAVGKEYRYLLYFGKHRDPFKRNYAFHFPYSLDLKAMEDAAGHLSGTHDFSSFCASGTEVIDKVRTIEEISFAKKEDGLVLTFKGNGFLYNMVRILTGTLLEVGRGERHSGDMPALLEARDRKLAGKTAPAHGLYLWEVFYGDN
ncbi:tRNA pseudouridine(38-40) synthase TruA [Neobacillus notoginsengisoli]|uniref:tRNA pseudouridine synthase A n=1 Tax=Neobacillus notoginsengisoli TaxID=1578198 RepID=A0A417YL31_9BACI|nr:tRNA pseudouridine(38-40) synthase TruA [Neobacillus notoginsengisoli]RHW33932.1 tRNA pseudouridine(38-40) synthase TruA [Neobacillus notoginsengisoli]